MSRFIRFSLIAAGACLLMMVGTGVVLAAGVATAVATDGLVMVSVHEKTPDGVHFTAPIPASLVGLGLTIAKNADDGSLDEARSQLEPVAPALLVALDQLEDAEDATLIHVVDGDDLVTVQKSGGTLVIDVDSDDARVHVGVPLRLVRQVISSLSS